MTLNELNRTPFYGVNACRIVKETPEEYITLFDSEYPEVAEFKDDYEKVIKDFGEDEVVSVEFSGESLGAGSSASVYADILIKG